MCIRDRVGLLEDASVPLIGMVTRLTGQKGLDLVEYALDQLMNLGVQLVVLGTGDERYVNLLKWAQWRYQQQLSACVQMDFGRARRILSLIHISSRRSDFLPTARRQR